MRGAPARGWFLVWPALVIVTGLAFHVFDPWGVVSALQGRTLLAFERLWPRDKIAHGDPTAPAVRFVDIDAESLRREGPWPWPRSELARLVSTLFSSGAKVVVLDLPLDEPDPTAPARALRSLAGTPEAVALKAAIDALPSSDSALAHAFGQGKAVTRYGLVRAGGEPLAKREVRLVAPAKRVTRSLPAWAGARLPIAPLRQESAGLGAALPLSSGATVLGVPLVYKIGDAVEPSLELEAVRLALGAPAARLAVAEPRTRYEALLGRPGLATIHLGKLAIPVSRQGVFWYYAAKSASSALSASQALGEVGRPELRDAVVIVGASGAQGAVVHKSSLGQSLPASALLADRIRQILSAAFIERPIWAEAGEELFMLVCGAALLVLLSHAPLAWPLATAAVAIGGAFYVSAIAFVREQWFLDPLVPSLTLALALGAGLAARWGERFAGARTGGARPAFAPAPQPARASGRTATGEERIVTVLACDIDNFADLLARYAVSPKALARLLRSYEQALGEIVAKNKGLLAFVRGGQALAAFNVAQNDTEHASNACNCALRMIDALEHLNGALAEEARAEAIAFEPLTIALGLATGPCLVSPPEAGFRPELLPVGATVALAETLQRTAHAYGSAIIADEETQAQAQRLFALLEIDRVQLPLRAEPVAIFALLGNPLVKASPKFRALQATHDEIFSAYRAQNWQLARALIRECRKLPAASAPLYGLYEARIADLEKAPPGPSWNGAHALAEA